MFRSSFCKPITTTSISLYSVAEVNEESTVPAQKKAKAEEKSTPEAEAVSVVTQLASAIEQLSGSSGAFPAAHFSVSAKPQAKKQKGQAEFTGVFV